MATDATGVPTSPDSIPTYNTSSDAPSGLGFNAAMAAIQAALSARAGKPSGIAVGEVPVWNGTGWDRSSVTRVGPTSLGSGTPDGTKALFGDGTWKVPTAGSSAQWAKAFRSTNLVITNSSNTIPALDTFASNTIGATLDGAGRVVVASAGLYLVIGYVPWPANATGTREIVLVHAPGSTIFAQDDITAPSGSFIGGQIATGLVQATAGDSIGLDIFQNSGGSLTIAAAGSAGMSLTVSLLGT